MATIIIDDDRRTNDDAFIEGCWGTVAEQTDEAFYDDRSDADDDLEKGRIKFPAGKLYGRQEELDALRGLYGEIKLDSNPAGGGVGGADEDDDDNDDDDNDNDAEARVAFVGGYSGVGKSALVAELVRQVREQKKVRYHHHHHHHHRHHHHHGGSAGNTNNVFCAHGKYSKLQSASIPFSAISDSLGQLAAELTSTTSSATTKPDGDDRNDDDDNGELLNKIGRKLRCLCGDDDDDDDDVDGGGDYQLEQVMRITFPSISPLFRRSADDDKTRSTKGASSSSSSSSSSVVVSPTMNEVKRAFKDCLSCICSCLDNPLIWFLDDCQWSDEASLILLKDVLASKEFGNVLFIGSYRSNEVKEEHPFRTLMNDVQESSLVAAASHVNLFGLSPDDIGEFISDTLGKDGGAAAVSTLTQAVYATTLGNIFFVKQALEELVRKNALFYDVMMFTWEYNLTKVELENHLSDDVIEMVQSKIEGLQPTDVKKLVVIISFLPNNADLSTIIALLECEGVSRFKVEKLLKYAGKQGMIIRKAESGKYAFTHDKIREAAFRMIPQGRARDELLMRISRVLMNLASSDDTDNNNEWAFFVAVDHMNSLLPELVPRVELSRLNYRVAEMNLARGATFGANASLLAALAYLADSGSKWKEYQFTLQLLNQVITSEFSVGNFEMAFSHVEDVLDNATSLDDKFTAYLYRMKTLAEGENRDYNIGIVEGLKTCERYGIKFTNPPKKSDLVKESLQLKAALRNRPLTVLCDLPPAKDSSTFLLLGELIDYSNLLGSHDLSSIIADRSIQLALQQKGRSKELLRIITFRAVSLAKDPSKLKTANKFAVAAEIMAKGYGEEGHKALHAETQFLLLGTVFVVLRPFRDCLEPTLDAYRPLLNAGKTMIGLGSGMTYSYLYLNAGLPLNSPLIEPKLILFGEACHRLQMPTFEVFFNAYRQMMINLRKQKQNWTILKGDVFDEDAFLRSVEGNARAMTLRDTSTLRLVLAFIFSDEECMVAMLENLSKFADPDIIAARSYLRLGFIGLAGFQMGQNKLANKCLAYFKSLSKLGSPNSTPIYHFMKAVAHPSRAKYDEAIYQCKEARMIHLEAMANERCGMFLSDNGDDASKAYIIAAYWLYNDWGASSKTNNMLEQHSFLTEATQGYRKAHSDASSNRRLANRMGRGL